MRTIIVGAGGSGKDYLKNRFILKGYRPSISFTTRPPREGEKNGKDYYFITKDCFETMKFANKFVEWMEFNGWYYGTPLSEFYSKDVFIMTPGGISNISKHDRDNSMIIYLDISEATRAGRLLARPGNNDVIRRLVADKKDFENFKEFDIRITNSDF